MDISNDITSSDLPTTAATTTQNVISEKIITSISGQSPWRTWFFGPSRRARALRITLALLTVATVIFSINAAVVGIAMYTVVQQAVQNLQLDRLKVYDLDRREGGRIQLQGTLDGGFAMSLFRISLEQDLGVDLKFKLPNNTYAKILTLTIPPFELGKAVKHFDFDQRHAIKVDLNTDFDWKHAIDQAILDKGKIQLRATSKVVGTTKSFWIPMTVKRSVDRDYPLDLMELMKKSKDQPPSSSSSPPPDSEVGVLDSIEITDNSRPDLLEVAVTAKIPKFPSYLQVDLPKIILHLGISDQPYPTPLTPVTDIVIERQHLSSEQTHSTVLIRTNRDYQDNLKKLIGYLLEGKQDFYLGLTGGRNDNDDNQFQKFLKSIDVRQPYLHIAEFLGFSKKGKELSESSSAASLSLSKDELISLGLVDLLPDDKKFVFELGIRKTFLSSVVGFEVSKLKGKIPIVALENVLLHQHVENPGSTIAHIHLEHVPEGEKGGLDEFLIVRCSLGLIQAVEASEFLYELLQKSPTQMYQQVTKYRKLLLQGLDDSLLSSLVSAFAFEVDLTRQFPTINYRRPATMSSDTTISNSDIVEPNTVQELKFGGYDFSVPSSIPQPAKYQVNAGLVQDQKLAELNLEIRLPLTPLLSNHPFLRLYWPSLDLVFSRSTTSTSTKLTNVHIDEGKALVSLSPINPIYLVHSGDFSLAAYLGKSDDNDGDGGDDDSDSVILLQNWRELIQDLFIRTMNENNRPPALNLQWKLGKTKKISIDIAAPSLKCWISPSSCNPNGANIPTSSSFFKRTIIRLTGLKDSSTLESLIRFPIEPMNALDAYRSLFSVNLTMPHLSNTWCRQLSGNVEQCLFRTDIGPLSLSSSIENFKPKSINVKLPGETHFINSLDDWIPLKTTLLIDFDQVLQFINPMSEALTISAGTSTSTSPHLFDRFLGSILANFPITLNTTTSNIGTELNLLDPSELAKIGLQIERSDWTSLEGNVKLSLPPASIQIQPSQDNALTGKGHFVELEWKRSTFKFELEGHELLMTIHDAHVGLRQGDTIPNTLLNDLTNEFQVNFAVNIAKSKFNSGNARRILEHLNRYLNEDQSDESNLIRQVVDNKLINLDTCFQSVPGQDPPRHNAMTIPLKNLMKVIKLWKSRPSPPLNPLQVLWKQWRAQVRLTPFSNSNDHRIVSFPCFIPQICIKEDDNLLTKASEHQSLFEMKASVSMLGQVISETIGSYLGRHLFRHLAMIKYPQRISVCFQTDTNVILASTINEIDMVEAEVFSNTLNFSDRRAHIYYEDTIVLDEAITNTINADHQDFQVLIRLPQYFHDGAGILNHLYMDAMGRLSLDPVPPYLTEQGEELKLVYSPLSLQPSNERLPNSNLFSTLAAIILQEQSLGPIISELGEQSIAVTIPSCSANHAKFQVEGLKLINPTNNIDWIIESPIRVDVVYRPQASGQEYRFGGGSLIIPTGNPLPHENRIVLLAGQPNPVRLEGHLEYDGSEQQLTALREFISKAAMRSPLSVTLEIHLLPDKLTWKMPVHFSKKAAPMGLIDSENMRYHPALPPDFWSLGLSLRNQGTFNMNFGGLFANARIYIHDRKVAQFFDTDIIFAQSQCVPLARLSDPSKRSYFQCIRANPAAALPPGTHLKNGDRVKGYYSASIPQLLLLRTEYGYRDGVCLDFNGNLSLDLISQDGNNRFPIDLAIQMSFGGPRGYLLEVPDAITSSSGIGDLGLLSKQDFDSCRVIPTSFQIKSSFVPSLILQTTQTMIEVNDPSQTIALIETRSYFQNQYARLSIGDQLQLECTFSVDFEVYLEESVPFALLITDTPLDAAFDTDYGFKDRLQGNSFAMAVDPKNSNCEFFQQKVGNGRSLLLARKTRDTITRPFKSRWLTVKFMYFAWGHQWFPGPNTTKQFLLDVKDGQDDFYMRRTLMTVDRTLQTSSSKEYNKRSLSQELASSIGYFALTCRGNYPFKVRNVQVSYVRPALELSEVYWLSKNSVLPKEEGTFIMRLIDEHKHLMGKSPNPLRIQLRLINPAKPRSVIDQIHFPDEEEEVGMDEPFGPDSLLYCPISEVITATVQFHSKMNMYTVQYVAKFPGRYAIYANDSSPENAEDDDSKWIKVKWHTIYVRHHW